MPFTPFKKKNEMDKKFEDKAVEKRGMHSDKKHEHGTGRHKKARGEGGSFPGTGMTD